MALRRTLAKRLFKYKDSSPETTLEHSPVQSPLLHKALAAPNAPGANFHGDFLASGGFFRRFLQRRTINQTARRPEFLSVPLGDKLREKLRSVNVAVDRLRLDGLAPPHFQDSAPVGQVNGVSVSDAKKILISLQLERLRSAIKQIPANSIPYSEYLQTCVDVCSNREQGAEFARRLDESGNVIVLGDVVFLRPEQVAKSVEKVISQSVALPNDPRRRELEHMEQQKAAIDRKAQKLVRGELYCGLGFLVLQTMGFMRLTFWELTWDVMEPICFFSSSVNFALAYAFFLRTSNEPTFEGYFRRRFKVKQEKLMKARNFDIQRYHQLCRAFYPNYSEGAAHA
ncbi:hypothetical protein NMG60_11016320 [Bertholletia excelsa]